MEVAMDAVLHVHVTGPLTRHVEGFAVELRSLGYTELSLTNQLRLLADFSRWLERSDVALEDLDAKLVERFLSKRRRTHTQFFSERAIRPLLVYLAGAGVIAIESPTTPRRRPLLEAYERYLVEDRAVGEGHKSLCVAVADAFLDGGRRDLATLSAADVTRFIQSDSTDLKGRLTGLRSILRFLFITKRLGTNLVYAVPRSPSWRMRALPPALGPQQIAARLSRLGPRAPG